VQKESQSHIKVDQCISNSVTMLKRSRQELQNSDLNKAVVLFTNSINESSENIKNQEKLSNREHIFYNKFLYIIAIRKIGGRNQYQYYKISNKYEVETNLSGLPVRCKTGYQQIGNIIYTVSCVNSDDNMVSSSSITLASDARTQFLMDVCNKPNNVSLEYFYLALILIVYTKQELRYLLIVNDLT
ncbi:11441_t:CDS:2, partial [Scutellospora calospora]